MLRTEIAFRPDSIEHGGLTTANHAGVWYIGLGDPFDDDRRFVREPAPRPALPMTLSTPRR